MNDTRPSPAAGSHAGLTERHLRELRASGLSDEVIAERGYRSVSSRAELHALGFADYQCRPGYLLPQHGPDRANDVYALKPDSPRVVDGKPRKYEWPAGQPNRVDVPPRCQTDLFDPAVDLWITESNGKKQDALAAAGKCAIGLNGVYGWKRDGEAIDDLMKITSSLDGRRVFIVFDSDPNSKPAARRNVGLAERQLANFLRAHGAWVALVDLPLGPDESKMAVDDFLLAHEPGELDKLADAASAQAIPPEANVERLKAEIARLTSRVRELEQLLSAMAELRRNRALIPGDRLIAEAIVADNAWQATAARQDARVGFCSRLADAAGVSGDRITASLKRLSAPGGEFDYHRSYVRTEDGRYTTVVEMRPRRPGDIVQQLKAVAACKPEPIRRTQKTPRCKHHPDAAVVTRPKQYVCTECGVVLEHRSRVHLKTPWNPHPAESRCMAGMTEETTTIASAQEPDTRETEVSFSFTDAPLTNDPQDAESSVKTGEDSVRNRADANEWDPPDDLFDPPAADELFDRDLADAVVERTLRRVAELWPSGVDLPRDATARRFRAMAHAGYAGGYMPTLRVACWQLERHARRMAEQLMRGADADATVPSGACSSDSRRRDAAHI